MSSRKKFVIVVLANICMMFAVNVFAQEQNADKKAEAEAGGQASATTKTTTSVPAPIVTLSTGAAPALPAPSPGAEPVVPSVIGSPVNVTPAVPRRAGSVQVWKPGGGVQVGQIFQADISKAEDEMQKARMQFEKILKDLEKNNNPEAMQKAREELQKSMQKAQDELKKAKAQLEKTTQEIRTIQVGPGAGVDPFGTGGGFGAQFGGGMGGGGGGVQTGGGFGGGSGGYGRAGIVGDRVGEVVFDGRTGQMVVSGPVSMTIMSDPEAKALRDKEQECTDKIGKIVDHYNSTPAASGDRAAIKTELEKAVGEQFAIRQEYRELQIKQLEKELARVRETIQKRTDNREQIIKRHIAQLLHEQEDMEF